MAPCDARHRFSLGASDTNTCLAFEQDCALLIPGREGAPSEPVLLRWGFCGGVAMREAVLKLWPEIEWIQAPELREQVTKTWQRALELSPLSPDDLNRIPFTLLVPNCPTTFMEHKRCVVHIARKAAESMK